MTEAERYARHAEKERARKRKAYALDPTKKQEYGRAYFLGNKERVYEYRRMKYRADPAFRMKQISRSRFRTRLLSGKIEKGSCAVCSSNNLLHAHHDDYSRPSMVVWFCRKHHFEKHRKEELL